MPSNLKFPSSVEIKRVIAAAIRAGIDIGSVEIQPRKITIHPRAPNASKITDYDSWKLSQGTDSSLVRHTEENSDALPDKSGG
jgi:hypothetical protein